MIPIFMCSGHGMRGLQLEDFEDRLIEICNEHQKEKRATAFGLILFCSRLRRRSSIAAARQSMILNAHSSAFRKPYRITASEP
jgi:hypothetical protein